MCVSLESPQKQHLRVLTHQPLGGGFFDVIVSDTSCPDHDVITAASETSSSPTLDARVGARVLEDDRVADADAEAAARRLHVAQRRRHGRLWMFVLPLAGAGCGDRFAQRGRPRIALGVPLPRHLIAARPRRRAATRSVQRATRRANGSLPYAYVVS
jgi:hypothetical protein